MLGLFSLFSIGQDIKAGKEAYKAGKDDERLEGILTDEQLRRLSKERAEVMGQQRLATAHNRVDLSSQSYLRVRANQLTEFAHEESTISAVGASRAATALRRGRNARTAAYSRAAVSAFSLFDDLANLGD